MQNFQNFHQINISTFVIFIKYLIPFNDPSCDAQASTEVELILKAPSTLMKAAILLKIEIGEGFEIPSSFFASDKLIELGKANL